MKLNILLVSLPASTDDIRRLNELQTRLPNPFAICLPSSTTTTVSAAAADWSNLQYRVTGGKIRLLLAQNGPREVVQVMITKLFDYFRNTEKLAHQEKFFIDKSQNLVSRSTARSILCSTFANLQIPEFEWEILMEALPSIAHIMTTNEETYLQSCPVSRETITKISRFFSCDGRNV